MQKLGLWGGLCGLVCAATYIFGFAIIMGPLGATGYGSAGADMARVLDFFAANPVLMSSWFLTIYVLNGCALVILVLALRAQAAPHAPSLSQVLCAFGMIWATLVIAAGMAANVGLGIVLPLHAEDPARAVDLWETVELVENGIGGGNEIVGGLLALSVGLASVRSGAFPRAFGIASLVIGVAGLLSIIRPLQDIAGAVFGLGYIAWFIWIGIILLLENRTAK